MNRTSPRKWPPPLEMNYAVLYVSFWCIIIKGTYSWAKIYFSYYAPKFLAEGLWKGLRVGRGCRCSCVIGMSPAGAQGMQKRGRLCFQITFVFIFLLVLIYIFFHLFYIDLWTQRKNACNSIPRSFLWPPTHTKNVHSKAKLSTCI